MAVILALGRQGAGPRVQGQPNYIISLRPAWITRNPVSKPKQTNLNKERFWDKDKEAGGRKPSETQIDVRGKTENGTSQNGDGHKVVCLGHGSHRGMQAKWQARTIC